MLQLTTMPDEIHTCEELKRQLHEDLRTQHPEWIQPDGKCPKCDEHETRLKELLETVGAAESKFEGHPQPLEQNQATHLSS
jgi:hypothetical protein